MPDLGKYALEVSVAYGASILLLFFLVLLSWVKGRKVRRQLRELEKRRANRD